MATIVVLTGHADPENAGVGAHARFRRGVTDRADEQRCLPRERWIFEALVANPQNFSAPGPFEIRQGQW
jgi:hypothetical protein